MRDWRNAPEVQLRLVRQPRAKCPHCGSERHRFVRSLHGHGDGSATRYMVCVDCSKAFIVLAYYDDEDDE